MSKKNVQLGSIFTPDYISEKMAEWAIQNKQDKILDLGIGEGAFVFASYERLIEIGTTSKKAQKQIFGSEIEENTFNSFQEISSAQALSFPNIKNIDFFSYDIESDSLYDVVIGNPPYVRRKNIVNVEQIRDVVIENSEISEEDLRYLSDLYIYFILYSASKLKQGGRLCVITADSWLNVGYGKVLRKYLTEFFEIEQVTILDYSAFDNAEVKAVIIQAHKKVPSSSFCTKFVHVKSEKDFQKATKSDAQSLNVFSIPQLELNYEQPWGIYWKLGNLYQTIISDPRISEVSAIAKTQIGYQTLAKDFFVFSEDKKGTVEPRFLKPIVNSPSEFTRTPVIDSKTQMTSFVFMCDLEKKDLTGTRALEYIVAAENKPVSVRGKNKTVIGYQSKNRMQRSGRKNWYDLKTPIEKRGGRCEILIPRFVFRDYLVLWNKEDFVTGEQFIEFHPKTGFSPKVFLAILNSTLTELMFRSHAQIYGGGTNNMSPGEFKRVPILDPNLISSEQRTRLEKAYEIFLESDLDRTSIDEAIYAILGYDKTTILSIREHLDDIIVSSTGKNNSH